MLNKIKSFAVNNQCYKQRRYIKVEGLILHSVGCAQPKASVFVKNWNNSSAKACVHLVLDNEICYELLPASEKKGSAMRCWGCGSGKKGSGNYYYIQCEMTEPSGIKYTPKTATFEVVGNLKECQDFVRKNYENAVEIFARYCKYHGLNPLGYTAKGTKTILSHHEAHEAGIASGHSDPEHLWKQLNLNYTMDGFRADVDAKMKAVGVITNDTNKNNVKVNASAVNDSYKVRVTASVLNVRKGPGTNYDITTTIKKNEVYTITETINGWGKLKSGVGYIYLKYTSKI